MKILEMRNIRSRERRSPKRLASLMSAGLCVLFAACATERPFTVNCNVRGALDREPIEYADIVEGDFYVDPARLERTPETPGGGCSPVEIRSKIFGDPAGTTLEIIAARCGPGDIYVGSKVKLNELPVLAHVKGTSSRIVFNEDTLKLNEPPITTPEGTFKFIYSDCEKKPAPRTDAPAVVAGAQVQTSTRSATPALKRADRLPEDKALDSAIALSTDVPLQDARLVRVQELLQQKKFGGDSLDSIESWVRRRLSSKNDRRDDWKPIQLEAALRAVSTPRDSPRLMELYDLASKNDADVEDALVGILVEWAPDKVLPAVLGKLSGTLSGELEQRRRERPASVRAGSIFLESRAFEAVVHSSHTAALRYCRAVAEDEAVGAFEREQAAVNLARWGQPIAPEIGVGLGKRLPPPRTEREKVLAAAYQATCRFRDSNPVFVHFPEGMEPFDVSSGAWAVVPFAPEHAEAFVAAFAPPWFDFSGQPRQRGADLDGPILWNDEGSEALVQVWRVSWGSVGNGYDVRVRRFGSDWVAVGLEHRWM